VDERIYFVDLPGYGYARVSKTTRDSLGRMIESYLAGSRQLKLALMLVDCRIPPTESDRMMKEWLDHYGIPNAVVLTKADKLSKNKLNQALRTSAEQLRTKEMQSCPEFVRPLPRTPHSERRKPTYE
jgi:GTP-binding protein